MSRAYHKKLKKAVLLPPFFPKKSGAPFILLLRRPALHIAFLVLLSVFYAACAEKNAFVIKKNYDVVYEKKEEVPVTYRAKQYEANMEDITAIESIAGNKNYNPAGLENYIYLSPYGSRDYGAGYSSGGAIR